MATEPTEPGEASPWGNRHTHDASRPVPPTSVGSEDAAGAAGAAGAKAAGAASGAAGTLGSIASAAGQAGAAGMLDDPGTAGKQAAKAAGRAGVDAAVSGATGGAVSGSDVRTLAHSSSDGSVAGDAGDVGAAAAAGAKIGTAVGGGYGTAIGAAAGAALGTARNKRTRRLAMLAAIIPIAASTLAVVLVIALVANMVNTLFGEQTRLDRTSRQAALDSQIDQAAMTDYARAAEGEITPWEVLAAIELVGKGSVTTPVTTGGLCSVDDMTPAQQAGQLVMLGVRPDDDPTALASQISTNAYGGVILMGDWNGGTTQVSAATTTLHTQAGQFGVIVAVDQEGGRVARLSGDGFSPIPPAADQAGTDDLTGQATTWGKEMAGAGIDLDLAPVADVVPAEDAATNEPIAATGRGYGSDPQAVADDVTSVVKGFSAGGIASAAKHFPGLGRVEANTDTAAGVTDTDTPADPDDPLMAPFRAAKDAGAAAMMVASATYTRIDPDNPAVFSPAVIDTMLRGGLGWGGLVISDDLGQAAQVADVAAADRATRFVAAGGDIAVTVDPALADDFRDGLADKAADDPDFAAALKAAAGRVVAFKNSRGISACTTDPAGDPADTPGTGDPDTTSPIIAPGADEPGTGPYLLQTARANAMNGYDTVEGIETLPGAPIPGRRLDETSAADRFVAGDVVSQMFSDLLFAYATGHDLDSSVDLSEIRAGAVVNNDAQTGQRRLDLSEADGADAAHEAIKTAYTAAIAGLPIADAATNADKIFQVAWSLAMGYPQDVCSVAGGGAGAASLTAESGAWSTPAKDIDGRVGPEGDFGPRSIGQGFHEGFDIQSADQKVYAAATGRVVFAGWWSDCEGNDIIIDAGGGILLHTKHLATGSMKVRPGDTVTAGQYIADQGNTGSCSQGAHVHFEVRVNEEATDPYAFMKARGVDILTDAPAASDPLAGSGSDASLTGPGTGTGVVAGGANPSSLEVPGPGGTITLDAEQVTNASGIIGTAGSAGASDTDILVALMTALQESTLRNLDYGDRDSLGLFQQRPSVGWGTPEQVRDVAYATTAFLRGVDTGGYHIPGLFDYPERGGWSLSQQAQTVQRSAFPDAYAKWEQTARAILMAVNGTLVPGTNMPGCPSNNAGNDTGAPGPWGGYTNGEIPASELAELTFPGGEGFFLRADAAKAADDLAGRFHDKFGHWPQVEAAYRSADEFAACTAAGDPACAAQGESMHGWALAIDWQVGAPDSEEYRWMSDQAADTGNELGTFRQPAWARDAHPEHWEYWAPAGAGNLAAAIEYARSQLGKPYVWGAEGPDAFDCSGLTMKAYEAAGITIPRTADEQWRDPAGTRIDDAARRPGDLLFFTDSSGTAFHVGIFIGDGKMLHAPNPSKPVEIDPVTYMDGYAGAKSWSVEP